MKKRIPLRCYQCDSHSLGNWKQLYNPNMTGEVAVGGAAARSLDRNVTPASVCVCERAACVQPLLGNGYRVVELRDGQHVATPTSAEEFVMIHILNIAKEEEGPGYDVLVEWDGYDRNDNSTWETLSAMLKEDTDLVKRELRELNLSSDIKRELKEQYRVDL